jgi:hypothetical protein
VNLEPQSAEWVRFHLKEQAEGLRKAAKKERTRAAGHIPIRKAAEHLAAVHDRAAKVYEEAYREISGVTS